VGLFCLLVVVSVSASVTKDERMFAVSRQLISYMVVAASDDYITQQTARHSLTEMSRCSFIPTHTRLILSTGYRSQCGVQQLLVVDNTLGFVYSS